MLFKIFPAWLLIMFIATAGTFGTVIAKVTHAAAMN